MGGIGPHRTSGNPSMQLTTQSPAEYIHSCVLPWVGRGRVLEGAGAVRDVAGGGMGKLEGSLRGDGETWTPVVSPACNAPAAQPAPFALAYCGCCGCLTLQTMHGWKHIDLHRGHWLPAGRDSVGGDSHGVEGACGWGLAVLCSALQFVHPGYKPARCPDPLLGRLPSTVTC